MHPYNLSYDLYPDRDLEIYAETLAAGWSLVERGETFRFAGLQGLILSGNFVSIFETQISFDPTGYAALRFAFPPRLGGGFSHQSPRRQHRRTLREDRAWRRGFTSS